MVMGKKMERKKPFFWEFIKYVFWGVLAAGVNTGFYALLTRVFGFKIVPSTVFAWLTANIFAFFCNLLFVFNEKSKENAGDKDKKREGGQKSEVNCSGGIKPNGLFLSLLFFLFSRLIGGAGDTAFMYFFCDFLQYPDLPVKILSAGVWGVLNYLLGRYIIFKKRS